MAQRSGASGCEDCSHSLGCCAGTGEGAAPLLAEVQAVEAIEVGTLLGDMAYSDGEVRQAVEEAGADLVAKVPPVTNWGLFPKTDFLINLAGRHRHRPGRCHYRRQPALHRPQGLTSDDIPLARRRLPGLSVA